MKLKERRLAEGLLQKDAAAICGITAHRWSDLERGYRFPSTREFCQISRVFGLGDCHVSPPESTRSLLNSGAALSPKARPYYPEADRPTYIRHRSAYRRHPEQVKSLSALIAQRTDYHSCEDFYHRTACDSALEALHLLYLLACGAIPVLVPPYRFTHVPHPVVDDRGRRDVGARPRPCLCLNSTFYFFQVSFSLSTTCRFDVMRWDQGWSILELNGAGHDARVDGRRASEVGLPVHNVTESNLLASIERLLARMGEKRAS